MAKKFPGVREIKTKKGIVYEIHYYPKPGAQKVFRRVYAESASDAFIIRATMMAKRSDTTVENLTFMELKEKLRLKCKADGNSPKTIINLMGKFKTLFEEFLPSRFPNVKSVNELTQQMIEQYKQYVVVDLNRAHGWRDELTKLKSIIGKLVALGYCEERIFKDVLKQFKKPKSVKKVYKEINLEEKRKLLNHIKEHRPDLYGITFLIMRLGWRREQVISLRREDIKFDGLTPVEIVCQPQNTKNKEPFVLRNFGKDITALLKQCYLGSQGSQWLFPNHKGKKVHSNNYSNYIAETSLEVLKKRLTPHDFRHMFCTLMKKQGLPERDIMAITGHKDVGSFQIYTHATGEGIKKVLESSKIF